MDLVNLNGVLISYKFNFINYNENHNLQVFYANVIQQIYYIAFKTG